MGPVKRALYGAEVFMTTGAPPTSAKASERIKEQIDHLVYVVEHLESTGMNKDLLARMSEKLDRKVEVAEALGIWPGPPQPTGQS